MVHERDTAPMSLNRAISSYSSSSSSSSRSRLIGRKRPRPGGGESINSTDTQLFESCKHNHTPVHGAPDQTRSTPHIPLVSPLSEKSSMGEANDR